jgi:hypothetical protein
MRRFISKAVALGEINSCQVDKILRMSWQVDDGKETTTPYFFFVDARRLRKHHSSFALVVLGNDWLN